MHEDIGDGAASQALGNSRKLQTFLCLDMLWLVDRRLVGSTREKPTRRVIRRGGDTAQRGELVRS